MGVKRYCIRKKLTLDDYYALNTKTASLGAKDAVLY